MKAVERNARIAARYSSAMTRELPVGCDGRIFEPVLERLRRLRHLNQDKE